MYQFKVEHYDEPSHEHFFSNYLRPVAQGSWAKLSMPTCLVPLLVRFMILWKPYLGSISWVPHQSCSYFLFVLLCNNFNVIFGVIVIKQICKAHLLLFCFKPTITKVLHHHHDESSTPFASCCQNSAKAKSQSWWSAANLEEIKVFLQSERDQGRFQPLFSEGLD